ncbi:insulinase family protein [Paucibacter sp. B2R-40]|uniref:M16 family metallopeptidase n=1 Tax=Paucibacter sp. B2R-40 TaxID=2893554 RepID=UPI0021E40E91|nr:M16 family metallopeptidase [Paucibacter sp. B2R-40]MCV2356678.1 insulinase family protein [Paucibacter sp. B2R-40]
MQRTARPGFRHRLPIALLAILALLTPLPLLAQASSPSVELKELRSLGGISEYRLSNGLCVLLMPVPKHPLTRVTLTYRVGSRHEGPGEAGMAHLLEHVTFRGTQEAPDLAAEMQQMQVRWNGTTTLDRTNYFSWFNPDSATLARVLQLEASRMQAALLNEQGFEKEKPIVLNEMGLRAASVAQQLHQALQANAYRQHPYGRPVIGFTSDIEGLSLQRLRSFYARHYRPDQAVLMISGAFDAGQALSAVVDAFGAQPALAPAAEPDSAPEPPQTAPRLSTLQTAQTALAVAYRTPGMAHADAPALMVLSQLLLGVTQRLAQDPAWPGRALLVSGMPISREPNLLELALLLPSSRSNSAAARRELAQFEERWLDELGQFIDPQRMGDALVRRVANEIAAQLRRQLQDPDAAAQLLSHAIGAGDWRLPFKLLDALPELRAYDVRKVAANYVRAENRSVARGVTDASVRGVESGDAAQGLLAGLFAKPAEVQSISNPSQGLEKIKSGGAMPSQSPGLAERSERLDADPAALEARVQRQRLPSGMQLALLPKPSANEQVSLLLSLRWGSAAAMASQQGWRALAAMLDGGAGKHSAADIQRLRQQLQADIRMQSGPQGLQVQIQARKTALLPALALLRDLLREPALADESFERVRKAALLNLEPAAREAPDSAQDRLRRYQNQQLSIGDPNYQPSAEDLLKIWRGLDAQQVRDFHARYWSANEARIAVVGDLPEGLSAGLESLFGDWKHPSAAPFVQAQQTRQPLAGARFIGVSKQPTEGAATVAMQQDLALTQQSPDYPALLLGTRLLAGDGASASGSRLAERLRQNDALSYNISATLQVPHSHAGDSARFGLQASSAPANAFKVEAALKEEITRLLSEGLGAAELERVRRQLLADRRQQRGQDAHLAAALLTHFELEMNFLSQQAAEDAALAAANPEQVLQALRRALLPQHWLILINGALSATP